MNQEEALIRERDMSNAYASVFSGPDGQRVLRDLNTYCGKDALCFDRDTHTEGFMLGTRSVALYIGDKLSGESVKRLEVLQQ